MHRMVALLYLFVIFGCDPRDTISLKNDSFENENNIQQNNNQNNKNCWYKLTSKSIELNDDQISNIDVYEDKIIISNKILEEIKIDNDYILISSNINKPFLRKIKKINKNSINTELDTIDAYLIEAFEELHLDSNHCKEENKENKILENVTLEKKVATQINIEGFDDHLRGSGEIFLDFSSNVTFRIDIENSNLRYFSLSMNFLTKTEIELQIALLQEIELLDFKIGKIPEIRLSPIIIGPLIIVPTIQGELELEVNLEGGIQFEFNQKMFELSGNFEVIYDGNQTQFEKNIDHEFLPGFDINEIPFELNPLAKGYLEISFPVNLNFRLYGIAGPGLDFGPYINLELNRDTSEENIECSPIEIKVEGGLASSVEGEFKFLNKEIEWEYNLIEFAIELGNIDDLFFECCGNGLCDESENCNNCEFDCGFCNINCSCEDLDRDGFYSNLCIDLNCSPIGDCNDSDFMINPNSNDICNNNIDEDCNGSDYICSNNSIPSTPSNVSVVYQSNNNWNYITWGASSNATSYTVFWKVGTGVTTGSQVLDPTSTTDYGHSGVVPGNQYCYRVRASNAFGNSLLSNETCVNVPGSVPGTPSNASVVYQSNNNWNYITWGASSNATSYTVFWKVGTGVTTGSQVLDPTSTTDYGHSGVVPGNQYCYRVRASNAFGNSLLSNEACVNVPGSVPGTPSNASVVYQSNNNWNYITWGASSNATSYTVFWKVGTGVTTGSQVLDPTSTTDYGHSGVVPGNQYCYRVRASNAFGNSLLSNETCVNVPGSVPGTPSNASVVYQSNNNWNYITWGASSNAASYTVFWKVGTGVTTGSQVLDPTSTTDYGHSGVVPGNQYCYKVRASNAFGNSSLSNETCVNVPGSVPGTPSNVSVVYQSNNNWNYITWGASSNATSYTVFWKVGTGVTTGSQVLDPTSTTDYGHSGVVPGNQYCYRVRASNAFGNSLLSNETCVNVPGSVPGTPSNASVVYQGNNNWNYITWGASSNATSYTVFWKVGTGVTTGSQVLDPTSTTDYGHSGVVPGNQYCYRVRASNAFGNSSLSNETCVNVR